MSDEKDGSNKPPLTFTQKLWREWIRPLGLTFIILFTVRSIIIDWNDVPTGSMEPTILPGDRIGVNKLAYGLRVPFTDKWIVHWSKPKRGEIVICFKPMTYQWPAGFTPDPRYVQPQWADGGERLVKRIVGVPGDTIEVKGGFLIVNGQKLTRSPLDFGTMSADGPERKTLFEYYSEDLLGVSHAVKFYDYKNPRNAGAVPGPRDFGPLKLGEGEYWMMGDNRDQSGDARVFGFIREDMIQGRSMGIALSFTPGGFLNVRWDRCFKGTK